MSDDDRRSELVDSIRKRMLKGLLRDIDKALEKSSIEDLEVIEKDLAEREAVTKAAIEKAKAEKAAKVEAAKAAAAGPKQSEVSWGNAPQQVPGEKRWGE